MSKYVEAVPRADLQQKLVKDDSIHCIHGDGSQGLADLFQDSAWHRNAAGESVCDVKGTVKVTGIIDYWLRTCHQPGLTIAECQGRYIAWDSKFMESKTLDGEEHQVTFQITLKDWVTKYSPNAIANKILADVLFGDFIDCFKNPLKNIDACAWAASNFIPFGTLAKIAKVGVALKVAVETGIGYNEARLLADAAIDGIKAAGLGTMVALGDRVAAFRLTLKDGIGTDEALRVLRADATVERPIVQELKAEKDIASYGRSCLTLQPPNSFPAGTKVLMGDGSTRAIETIRAGDTVTATDVVTGDSGPRTITNTIYTPDDRDFTEITVRGDDGTQSTVTATDHHPFWVESTRFWTDAADLHIGDMLRTDTGATAQVASIRHWTGLEPAYNLTVDGLHTYYILAGNTTLLVHNDGGKTQFENCQLIYNTIKSLKPRTDAYTKTEGLILIPDGSASSITKWYESKIPTTYSGGRYSGGEVSMIADINKYLSNPSLGITPLKPGMNFYPTADHVETKIAWKMAAGEINQNYVMVVINNSEGMCNKTPWTCTESVSAILYTDQLMVVHWLDEEGEMIEKEILGTRKRPGGGS